MILSNLQGDILLPKIYKDAKNDNASQKKTKVRFSDKKIPKNKSIKCILYGERLFLSTFSFGEYVTELLSEKIHKK